MELFDSCFGAYDPGSAIVGGLPERQGQARENAIVRAVESGSIPYFNRQWVKVPVAADGMTGAIFVTPDYFSVGVDNDFVRMPLMPATAEAIGARIDARLPTRKMVRDIHAAAPQKLAADPWGPPYDSSMMTTSRFVQHNDRVSEQFNKMGYALGKLTSGHKKDVVVTPMMDGQHVCIYGWFRDDSVKSAIQGPNVNCSSHGSSYVDYSHGVRFVKNAMVANGETMLVHDVLRHPKLHRLVSDQGPFLGATSYTAHEGPAPQPLELPPSPSELPPSPADDTKFFVGLIFAGLGFLGAQTLLG